MARRAGATAWFYWPTQAPYSLSVLDAGRHSNQQVLAHSCVRLGEDTLEDLHAIRAGKQGGRVYHPHA
jgi:hypothetical protein